MSNNCKYYYEKEIKKYKYDKYTGQPQPYYITVGCCQGTREQDEVSCDGNPLSPDCIYFEEHAKQLKEQYEDLHKLLCQK